MPPKPMSGMERSADAAAARRPVPDPSDAATSWSSVAGLVMADAQDAETVPGVAVDNDTRSTPSASVGAAPFDMPAFLQILPKVGMPAAVAAARDPTMAQALRRLPENAAIGERPTPDAAVSTRPIARQDGPQIRLPSFLAAAGRPAAVKDAARGIDMAAVGAASAEAPAATIANPFAFDVGGGAIRSVSSGLAAAAAPNRSRVVASRAELGDGSVLRASAPVGDLPGASSASSSQSRTHDATVGQGSASRTGDALKDALSARSAAVAVSSAATAAASAAAPAATIANPFAFDLGGGAIRSVSSGLAAAAAPNRSRVVASRAELGDGSVLRASAPVGDLPGASSASSSQSRTHDATVGQGSASRTGDALKDALSARSAAVAVSSAATAAASAAAPAATIANPFAFDLGGVSFVAAGAAVDPSLSAQISAGSLDAPVGSDVWQDQLGAQLSVMASTGGESEAVMKLAPEGLGELEIRVLVRDGQASLQFGASNADARQAIEVAQPRLRELFISQGMDISNFSVFNTLTGNPHSAYKQGESHARPARSATAESDGLQVRVTVRTPQGIVDTYA